jgi:TPR repeat protein
MYHEGKGLFQDKKEATRYYKRACSLGKGDACSQLDRLVDSKSYSGKRGWKFQ